MGYWIFGLEKEQFCCLCCVMCILGLEQVDLVFGIEVLIDWVVLLYFSCVDQQIDLSLVGKEVFEIEFKFEFVNGKSVWICQRVELQFVFGRFGQIVGIVQDVMCECFVEECVDYFVCYDCVIGFVNCQNWLNNVDELLKCVFYIEGQIVIVVVGLVEVCDICMLLGDIVVEKVFEFLSDWLKLVEGVLWG